MANQRILFLSDNEATVYVVNRMSLRDPIMKKLVRRLVMANMKFNTGYSFPLQACAWKNE